ncbi:BREX-1 system phosphatase PglZ type A, partial [Acidobacteriota bacterium]
HAVVFVYHNRIDAVGDKKETEEKTLEAVEETLEELVKVIKKLTGANANNLLVTADHGFIYQDRAVAESDFIETTAAGQGILYRDRRFILGKGLSIHPGLKGFNPVDIGLSGDIEIHIPKSINRLRLQGSGSRYVHGGSALQEVVVPVLHINKKRQSDITVVEVEIFRGAASVITSGQLSVALYQAQPVSNKVQPRSLHAGIYNREDELISDSHLLTFDLTSENPREREMHVRFVLTKKAEQANGQEVTLRLEEPLAGTSHFSEYKSVKYIMRRSFTSDFEF